MSQSSQTDPLTGLLTRTAFEDDFKTLMNTVSKTGQTLSLAFLDIDNFLQVNEAHGHIGGDQVLEEIAEILRAQTGDDNLVARYGGDEFVLLFPYTVREQAFLILEGIRREIENRQSFGNPPGRNNGTGSLWKRKSQSPAGLHLTPSTAARKVRSSVKQTRHCTGQRPLGATPSGWLTKRRWPQKHHISP